MVGPLRDFKVNYIDKRDGEVVSSYCDISKGEGRVRIRSTDAATRDLAETWNWFQRNYKRQPPAGALTLPTASRCCGEEVTSSSTTTPRETPTIAPVRPGLAHVSGFAVTAGV